METQKVESEQLPCEVEPPTALASRTCAKIWEALDRERQNGENQNCAPNSSIFMDSAYFSPESMLPPSFLLQTSEPDISKPDKKESESPKAAKKVETEEEDDEERPPRSSHWLGLIASVSVGMVIAVFLFPMLEFAKRSTRSYVAESWMTEINRRVDQYEQIHGNTSRSEELQPLNLALHNWQELYSDVFASALIPPATLLFTAEPTHRFVEISPFVSEGIIAPVGNASSEMQTVTILDQQLLPGIDLAGENDSILFEADGLSESLLLSIPRSWDGTARSAYGRDVLIQDGRVFFRVLPNRE